MELTPELLLEAKFGPARKGYDMAEVDDFLERCAEGLDVLLARLRSEFERAERAEARLAELESGAPAVAPLDATIVAGDEGVGDDMGEPEPAPAPTPSPDEPMRILVHAERTAEAAIAEARAEAERIRTEAESVAGQQRSEAERLLATARTEAEAEARRAGEETKRTIQTEVQALRRDRDGLADDVRSLRRWLDEQRTRLRTTARELQRLVEDPGALRDVSPPDMSEPAAAADDDEDDTTPEERGDDDGEPTQAVPIVGTEDRGADDGDDGAEVWAGPTGDDPEV